MYVKTRYIKIKLLKIVEAICGEKWLQHKKLMKANLRS